MVIGHIKNYFILILGLIPDNFCLELTLVEKSKTRMTHDLDPSHYFYNFFAIKNRKTSSKKKLFGINPKIKIKKFLI